MKEQILATFANMGTEKVIIEVSVEPLCEKKTAYWPDTNNGWNVEFNCDYNCKWEKTFGVCARGATFEYYGSNLPWYGDHCEYGHRAPLNASYYNGMQLFTANESNEVDFWVCSEDLNDLDLVKINK